MPNDRGKSSLEDLGYSLRLGSALDRATLVKFMERTYGEISPGQPLGHIAATVDRYLSADTPLWWAIAAPNSMPVGGLWLGQATDQRSGLLHPYILLLYVDPDHRRRGLAKGLLAAAHRWAQQRGYPQITLQVFSDNLAAQALYRGLGYLPEAVLMKKNLVE